MTFYEAFVDEMDKTAKAVKPPGLLRRGAKKAWGFAHAHPIITALSALGGGYALGKRKGKREAIPSGAVGGHGL